MQPDSPFDPALQRALMHSLSHLHGLKDAPVGATASLATLRARLAKPLGAGGLAADTVIDELVADTAGGITGNAGGRLGDYDPHGRARRIETPDGKVLRMTYTERGLLSSQTVSAGGGDLLTSYDYDAAGLLRTVTGPGAAPISFSYDDAHRLTRISDSLGNAITYDLDLAGNRVGETTADHTGMLVRSINRVYDTFHFLKQVTGAAQ